LTNAICQSLDQGAFSDGWRDSQIFRKQYGGTSAKSVTISEMEYGLLKLVSILCQVTLR
jgi:hypothetical protein